MLACGVGSDPLDEEGGDRAAQQAGCTVKVTDHGKAVKRAFIEIFEQDNLIDTDYTDENGDYTYYLLKGTEYTFRATKNSHLVQTKK
jgi:hypothetical protein